MNLEAFQLIVGIGGVVLTLLNTWVIFAVKGFRSDVAALRETDTGLAKQLGDLNTLLAGQYVLRADFKEDMRDQTTQLKDAMDRMEIRMTERMHSGTVR